MLPHCGGNRWLWPFLLHPWEERSQRGCPLFFRYAHRPVSRRFQLRNRPSSIRRSRSNSSSIHHCRGGNASVGIVENAPYSRLCTTVPPKFPNVSSSHTRRSEVCQLCLKRQSSVDTPPSSGNNDGLATTTKTQTSTTTFRHAEEEGRPVRCSCATSDPKCGHSPTAAQAAERRARRKRIIKKARTILRIDHRRL